MRILMSAVSADWSPAIVLVTVGADNIAIRGDWRGLAGKPRRWGASGSSTATTASSCRSWSRRCGKFWRSATGSIASSSGKSPRTGRRRNSNKTRPNCGKCSVTRWRCRGCGTARRRAPAIRDACRRSDAAASGGHSLTLAATRDHGARRPRPAEQRTAGQLGGRIRSSGLFRKRR